jgi:hypothetical protein
MAPRNRGQWGKGQSGNQAGRKPGTRNRATRLRELVPEDAWVALLRVIVARALAGDAAYARLLLSRIAPSRGGPCAPVAPELTQHLLDALGTQRRP